MIKTFNQIESEYSSNVLNINVPVVNSDLMIVIITVDVNLIIQVWWGCRVAASPRGSILS